MKGPTRTVSWLLAAALLSTACPLSSQGKGYTSGGGHSYSSSSSRSSGFSSSRSSGSSSSRSSGGGLSHSSGSSSKSYQSGSGKSYSSGSTWKGDSRHGYSSGKTYSSSPGHGSTSGAGAGHEARPARPALATGRTGPERNRFSFDTAAARAKKEEVSQREYKGFKEAQSAPARAPGATIRPPSDAPSAPSYQGKPPPVIVRNGGSYRPAAYIPNTEVIVSRPARVRTLFETYYTRPVVVYRDPYNSLFWWWLLDRSLEERASWAYHHRYDMDPVRYQALVANDQQLEARVEQLEAGQTARDPNYVPAGVDRDLMYSDGYVAQAYSNRPTLLGVAAFWALGVPTAIALSVFFIWLIWFKRWQTAN
jgi:hypothetical protein